MQNGDSSSSANNTSTNANTSAWKKFTTTISGIFKPADDPNHSKAATERTPLSAGTKPSYTKR